MNNNFLENFICGYKFQAAADIIIDKDHNNITRLKDEQVIWCKTDYLQNLFDVLNSEMSTKSFILITHNSDTEINKELFQRSPRCIKKWFAQNVNYKHVDLIPLPIGIENDKGPDKGSSIDINIFNEVIDQFYRPKIFNKLYCNWGYTHPNRNILMSYFSTKPFTFCTTRKGFKEYLEKMSIYQFIASPRGNGIDCHRTWESLYLGSIPLVDEHFMYDTYELPIIQVKDWNDVNEDFLINEFKKLQNKNFNYEQLNINWWVNKINNERNLLWPK